MQLMETEMSAIADAAALSNRQARPGRGAVEQAITALLREPLSFASGSGGLTLVPPGRCLLLRRHGSATLAWHDGREYRELALCPDDLQALLSSGTLALDKRS